MMGVVRRGHGSRIAARLRDRARRTPPVKRDVPVNVYIDPPKPEVRIVVVPDPRIPRAGWGR
jgi:hypothetical protein